MKCLAYLHAVNARRGGFRVSARPPDRDRIADSPGSSTPNQFRPFGRLCSRLRAGGCGEHFPGSAHSRPRGYGQQGPPANGVHCNSKKSAPMANAFAIHSAGNALVTYLRDTYPAQLQGRALPNCAFELLASGGLSAQPEQEGTRIGLLLYQITISEHQRPHSSARLPASGCVPLGLDLHYLLTAWGATPQEEQIPLAWAIRQLHATPILDASILSPEAGWQPDEILQVLPAAIPVEELMRIWDSLNQAYRLSLAYVVRGLRLDAEPGHAVPPVVARRFKGGLWGEDGP